MRYERSCGAVVFKKNKDIKYLLLKNGLGRWTFVKGLKEKNERDEETAIREMEEEAGIKKFELIKGFSYESKYFYRWEGELVNKHATFFLIKALEDKVKLSFEHKDHKWVTIDNALALLKIKSHKDMLIKAHKFLQK